MTTVYDKIPIGSLDYTTAEAITMRRALQQLRRKVERSRSKPGRFVPESGRVDKDLATLQTCEGLLEKLPSPDGGGSDEAFVERKGRD